MYWSSKNHTRMWRGLQGLILGSLIAALSSTCTVEPPQEAQTAGNTLGSTTIPVDVWVMTRNDGTGNELWDYQYTQNMLWHASAQVDFTVSFWLRSFDYDSNTDDYDLNQGPLLSYLRSLRTPSVITVVISNPNTTDSAGVSFVQYSNQPFLVMRSRFQDWSGLDPTSHIFLHELGHNMNLQHWPQDRLGLPFHADDYWQRQDGRQYLLQYARSLIPPAPR